MRRQSPIDVDTAMHHAHCREDRCSLGCACLCHQGLAYPPLYPDYTTAATISLALGIASLVLWPLSGAALLSGVAVEARGRRRRATGLHRAVWGQRLACLSALMWFVILVLAPHSRLI